MYHKDAHIHFVGIGGIGMSGIALVLKRMGYVVSGCDSNIAQLSIKNLAALGIKVYEGHTTPGCQDSSISYVVHTTDIAVDHPELKTARERGIWSIDHACSLNLCAENSPSPSVVPMAKPPPQPLLPIS